MIRYVNELVSAMRRTNEIHPYKTIALAILPDHLHAMWEFPEGDHQYSLRWRCVKTLFAKNIRRCGVDVIKNRFGENILWQRRFWEHTIRNEQDYKRHVDYIHYNPVKHQLVKRVSDWRYSTFHRYVRDGMLPSDWSYHDKDLNIE